MNFSSIKNKNLYNKMTIIDDHEIGKTDRPEIIDDSDYPEEIEKAENEKKDEGKEIISKKKLKDMRKQL